MSTGRSASTGWRAGGALLLRTLPGISPAFLIVALLGCMLVPLPTALVDLLLSISLAGAVLLLVASLKIERSTRFLGFPQLLLLATLYRLAINVSTTRLILSQADAGEVIDAFAGFVVRDDLVVGVVMFAIITTVQYVVIARGSERVAEVGARFALDGLPGHQAAIDADLRAGVISAREASKRRAHLAERSNFYGSMDGAVKFVKGDAVVGLIITSINLVAGLAIGVGRMGYSWQQSLEIYGRLTVGDGLLAQIPALLVSLAAGVLVSRVDREEEGARPRAMAWLDPAMLLVPAAMLLALAVVPRMPSLAFATTAVALVTAALYLAGRRADTVTFRQEPRGGVRVRVPSGSVEPRAMAETLAELRREGSGALGLELPRIEMSPDLPAGSTEVVVSFRGRVLSRRPLDALGPDALAVEVYRALVSNGRAFVDAEVIERWIQDTRSARPAVVQEALEHLTASDLLRIVQAFARERVPLPGMDALLAAVCEEPLMRERSEEGRWAELLRTRTAQYWVHDVLDATRQLGPLRVVRAEPDLEEELMRGTVTRARREELLQQARTHMVDAAPARWSGGMVMVATPRGRAALARALGEAHPHVPVLSTAELDAAGVELETDAWLA